MGVLHVLFRVENAEYALPASEVLHMETFTGATRVPGTPEYVLGLVQIRQRVVPVVDLRARFGLGRAQAPEGARVIVVQPGGRTVGLLVDSAREVANLTEDQLRPPPEMLGRQAAGFVRSVAEVKGRLVMLIDVHRVLGEETQDAEQPHP